MYIRYNNVSSKLQLDINAFVKGREGNLNHLKKPLCCLVNTQKTLY